MKFVFFTILILMGCSKEQDTEVVDSYRPDKYHCYKYTDPKGSNALGVTLKVKTQYLDIIEEN